MGSQGVRVVPFVVLLTSASLAASPHHHGNDMTELMPAKSPHPEPRVIVTVRSVQGPHELEGVQRAARNGWGRIVSCYKSFGLRKRGSVELELVLSAQGRVVNARHSGGSLTNPELVGCLAGVMKRAEMPAARARSRAITEIQLGPGDAS